MTFEFCPPRRNIEVQRLIEAFVSEAATSFDCVSWMFGCASIWGCLPTCEPEYSRPKKSH